MQSVKTHYCPIYTASNVLDVMNISMIPRLYKYIQAGISCYQFAKGVNIENIEKLLNDFIDKNNGKELLNKQLIEHRVLKEHMMEGCHMGEGFPSVKDEFSINKLVKHSMFLFSYGFSAVNIDFNWLKMKIYKHIE